MKAVQDWTRAWTLDDGTRVRVRQILPSDGPKIRDILLRSDPADLRSRFFETIKEIPDEFIARLTRVDPQQLIAFAAIEEKTSDIVGTIRVHRDLTGTAGEFAIFVRSDFKHKGLGRDLMSLMIEYATASDLKSIVGTVLIENTPMLNLCRQFGFKIRNVGAGEYLVTLDLTDLAQREAVKELA
jgi:acetyltransferase